MNPATRTSNGLLSISPRRDETRIRERELLRVAGVLGGDNAADVAASAKREVLMWAKNQVGRDLPELAWEGRSFEYLTGGRTCIASALQDNNRALWALRVDRPDRDIAQRVWTTEVAIGYRPAGTKALFSLRLLVHSSENPLQVEPAVPGLVRQISLSCGLHYGAIQFEVAPSTIETEEQADALVDFLVDPARTLPVFLCSLKESDSRPALDVRRLAKTTLGIAKVMVIPAEFTWMLTRSLGKPLSVFNGAVRAYMPGFSYDANPYAHRLFLVDQQPGDDEAKRVSAALRWIAANESIRRLRLGDDVLAFSAVREASLDFERERLKRIGSGDAEQLQAAQVQIDALKEDLGRAITEVDQWFSEYEKAEQQVNTLQQQLRGAQYRVQQLLDQIKARGESPDTGIKLPETWGDFADWCDEALSGRVTLSGRARREVKSPEFDDPKTAARCLLWLANEYRDTKINGGSTNLRKPLEEGIRNDRCGADSFELDWDSRRHSVEWHIKNGGNTRDPRRCLRIYYFWDEASLQVVIATMPAHIRTGAT